MSNTATEKTFYDRALIGVSKGIPVIPVQPGEKPCTLKSWQELATLDLAQIREWDAENHDYNVGYVAKLELGAPCFLEFDVKRGLKEAAEEMCQPYPKTRTDMSGKGFGHFIFTHTEKSLRLGNRQAKKDGAEWFSFRADNRYIVGADSVHPNGRLYKVVTDVKPIPIPPIRR